MLVLLTHLIYALIDRFLSGYNRYGCNSAWQTTEFHRSYGLDPVTEQYRMLNMNGTRLDKWLWAARFFKTRSKAKEAIDGGKVRVNGARGKPGKEISINDELRVRQRWDEKHIIVKGISEHRRGAPEARLLYEETPASIEKRELAAEQRRAAGSTIISENKPGKKSRRQLHQFLDRNR